MRIAEVSPYDLGAPGGVQTQVRQLSAQLTRLGHDVTIVGPGASGWEWLRPIARIRANDAVASIAVRPSVWWELPRHLAEFDVVHLHEPLMPLVGPAAVRTPAPVVGTFHADPQTWVRRLLRAGWGGRSRRRLRALTAVSPVARSAVPAAEVAVIPNGVDDALFVPGAREPGLVLFVGRDDPRKGLDVLVDVWPAVAARVPHARLVVVSDRAEGPHDIEWVGPVDDQARTDWMRRAAVVCAPNLRGESFGMVVAEALAAGAGVVASDLPAFRWVAGGAADYVRPGDAESLGYALVHRLRSPADPDAQRARAARFRWAVIGRAYERIIREIG